MKPVLKWAGGKTQLLDKIMPLIPEYKNYFEPFFGSGALFFALNPKKAYINDFNPQLINLYIQIKDNPKKLINKLNNLALNHSENFYYKIRDKFNKCLKNNKLNLDSAAYMLYLNKTCFNGLFRLNSKGLFNVPSAHKTKVNLFDETNLYEVSNSLKNQIIMSGDFEKAVQKAKAGDFVFFDSPYYNTFDTYQSGGFSEADHVRLKEVFDNLTKKGVKCLLTNSNEKFIKDLYKDYKIKIVKVKRLINRDASKRSGTEVIITNY